MDNANVIEGSATVVPASNMSLASVLRIPAVRQVMLLIGVAAAVAVGFAIVLWSQTPGYTQLYGNVDAAESAEITDALRSAGIEFKVNPTTGAILVPESSLATARMQLAAGGVAPSLDTGMSRAFENNSFGDPNFVLDVRYQAALEAELSRTISSLGAVREARVHLALPKQSSFLRDDREPTASVLVHLYRGRTLEDDQAGAIVNLVAASVPNLQSRNVTVVDQNGIELSSSTAQSASAQATSQFNHARRHEEMYKQRIEDMLSSIVGPGRVRAEVSADMEFTEVASVSERFDPQSGAVRSEQTSESLQTGDGYSSGGVPGALTNQPPEAAAGTAGQTVVAEDTEIQNSSRSSTRNFEMDRTITSTRPQTWEIRRLNVAVLIDTTPPAAAPGEEPAAAQPLSQEVIDRYTTQVEALIPFDAARGDRVVVMGESFLQPPEAAPMEEPAIWEQPFVRDLLKQFLGAAIVLAIAFGVLRPMLRGVVASTPPQAISGEFLGSDQGFQVAAAMPAGEAAALSAPSFEEKVAAAKNITGHDPARVAQVVKKWVGTDE